MEKDTMDSKAIQEIATRAKSEEIKEVRNQSENNYMTGKTVNPLYFPHRPVGKNDF